MFFPIDLSIKKEEKNIFSKIIHDSEESEIIQKSSVLYTIENEINKKQSFTRIDEAKSYLIKKIIQFYFIYK